MRIYEWLVRHFGIRNSVTNWRVGNREPRVSGGCCITEVFIRQVGKRVDGLPMRGERIRPDLDTIAAVRDYI